jgi:uncharacterized protein (TIGR02145 family)
MKIQFFSVIVTLVFFSCKKNDNNNPINSIDPPINPVQLKANVVSVSRVVLEWIDSSSNEDGFLIERKGSGTAYATVGTTNSNTNTFEDTGIQTDSTYTYRIYAFNLSGRSAQSTNELTVMIPHINLQGVTIGSQIWSAKNLDVTQYLNGDPIPQVSNPLEWETLTTGAWCWYDNDSVTYASVYGKLYNWYAVMDSRGLAPDGWRVPLESDWNKLIISIDPNADTSCPASCTQSIFAGGELKETGLSHWFNPNNGANNSTGFTALPGGGRDVDGSYFYLGNYGHWWSAGSYNESDAFIRTISYSGSSIKKGVSYKKLGYSVRVVKN